MAFTEKYVATVAAGAADGSTINDPMNWATLTGATWMTKGDASLAGTRFNIKSGTYNLSSTDTWTSDGTTASPIILRGYYQTPGDLDPGGEYEINRNHATYGNNYRLVTTYMPVILYSSGFYLNSSGSNNIVFQNLKISANNNNSLTLNIGINSVTYHCVIINAGTGNATCGIRLNGTSSTAIECDSQLTGNSTAMGAFYVVGGAGVVAGCRVIESTLGNTGHGFYFYTYGPVAFACVCEQVGGDSFANGNVTTSQPPPIIINCTSYNALGSSVSGPNADLSYSMRIFNSILTGSAVAIKNNYASDLSIHSANNAIYATSSSYSGFDGTDNNGWQNATCWNQQTPSSATSEYRDYANNDFNLVTQAKSRQSGVMPYQDIGALQTQTTYLILRTP